jgi:transposase
MPRKPNLGGNRRTVIHLKLDQKLSYTMIEKKTGVPLRTIKRWVKDYCVEGRLENYSPPGRSRSVRTKQHIKYIETQAKGNEKKSTRSLTKQLRHKFDIGSRTTVRRILKEDLNLKPYRKLITPKLSGQQKKFRIKFANHHLKHKTNFQLWAFSDEKKFTFEQKHNAHNDIVWNDTPIEQRCTKSKFGGGSVEVWGAITSIGKPDLIFIPRTRGKKFTAFDFLQQVLKQGIDEINQIFISKSMRKWCFQQDGDTKHTSKQVQDYLHANTPSFLQSDEWPSNSPDLNIIENVWDYMDQHLYPHSCTTIKGFKRRIQNIWKQTITDEYIQSLYDSVPRRLQEVKKLKGETINY